MSSCFSPYGHEKFSSFQEFETQLALGSIDYDTLSEVATDDESPNTYRDLILESCRDLRVLEQVVSNYKDITAEQLKRVLKVPFTKEANGVDGVRHRNAYEDLIKETLYKLWQRKIVALMVNNPMP